MRSSRGRGGGSRWWSASWCRTASANGSARSTDPVSIDVSLSGTVVRVEVTDAGGGFEPPPPPRRGTLASGGWGLVVVDALADRWGVSTARRRSRVWAELELDGAGAAETAHR